MLRPLLLAVLLGLPLLPAAPAHAAEAEEAVNARSLALDLAGAFSNDGYKIRDGHWTGSLKPGGEGQVLTVNLYAGNQYYFALGAGAKAKKLGLTVFDETGRPVPGAQVYQDADRALVAAGVSPLASGPYFVQVRLLEGEPSDFCLVYTYK